MNMFSLKKNVIKHSFTTQFVHQVLYKNRVERILFCGLTGENYSYSWVHKSSQEQLKLSMPLGTPHFIPTNVMSSVTLPIPLKNLQLFILLGGEFWFSC